MKLHYIASAFALLALSCSSGVTGKEEVSGQVDVFARDVLPVLSANCASPSCHNAGTPAALSSGFAVLPTASASYQSIMADPDLIVPRKPGSSRIFEEIAEGEMPPGGGLQNSAVQELIGAWITEGAPRYGDDDTPLPVASYETADGIRGGKFYDQFYASGTGFAGQPSLGDDAKADIAKFGDFYRCKQCHGWDRLGRSGAYANRGPKAHTVSGGVITKAGRPNVSSVNLVTLAASKTPDELFALVKGVGVTGRRSLADDITDYNPATRARVGDAMPRFGEIMTDAEIWDLVKFLKVEALDTSALYTLNVAGAYPTGVPSYTALGAGGNAASGDAVFGRSCTCHGPEGASIDLEGMSLGQFIRSKPYEAQHKAKFGAPGTIMGSILTDPAAIKNLFAAINDTTKYPNLTPYLAADGIRGGALYDQFYAYSTGYPFTTKLSDADYAKITSRPDFFRCKQCHGWDLLGRAGAYISRAPKATRPNVAALDLAAFARGSTAQEIYDALTRTANRRSLTYDLTTYDPATNSVEGDKMPDLNELFTTEDLWNLTKFLKKEALDVTTLYDTATAGSYPTGTATFSNVGLDGDGALGKEQFALTCAPCHGADGRAIVIDEDSLGVFFRTKPYEAWIKAKFGTPDSYPTMRGGLVTEQAEVKNLLKALTDTAAFPALAP